MSRLTKRNSKGEAYCLNAVGVHRFGKEIDKLAHYEDMEEAGRLIETHQAVVILTEAFGNEHPCNFNGNDEWLPNVCRFTEFCDDIEPIKCWEQYFKIKLAELKGGAEQ